MDSSMRWGLPRSSVEALFGRLGEIEDPCKSWRVVHLLCEGLRLLVSDCDDAIAEWDEANLVGLRKHLPHHHSVPGYRWLMLLLGHVDPDRFAQAFIDRVRAA